MANNYFKFKQFIIHQEKCAMKVGTDGVLLGAWANCENTKHVLDIGTGTGLIALMIAQRSQAIIDAIEIDENACMQAQDNFQKSPWYSRINLVHQSFQDYATESNKKYDLIVLGPNEVMPKNVIQSQLKYKLDYTFYINGLAYWRVYKKDTTNAVN